MQDLPSAANPQREKDLNGEILWLLGQPELDDYLDFVKKKVVGGDRISPRLLADEWRTANDLFHELEKSEAGAADTAECLPVDPLLNDLVGALENDPHYRASFDTLPVTIEMVELDKLVVSQSHVANLFCEDRARTLGPSPAPEVVFRFCLPLERADPPVHVRRLESGRYLFSSPSTDLRSLEPLLLRAEQCQGIDSHGPIGGLLACVVGFGPNFMTAIRSDRRLLLHNGYHRAYTLRSLGITHAPCIVETVTRTSELRVTASDAVATNPAFYFRAGRPPMLRDFFNPSLVKRLPVRPLETMIEVELRTRSWTSTDFSS